MHSGIKREHLPFTLIEEVRLKVLCADLGTLPS